LEHIAAATTYYIGLTLFISILVIYMKRECCASSPKPNEPYRNSALGSDSVKKK
jgi:hypothetical protein